jgi:hypothetical protein
VRDETVLVVLRAARLLESALERLATIDLPEVWQRICHSAIGSARRMSSANFVNTSAVVDSKPRLKKSYEWMQPKRVSRIE